MRKNIIKPSILSLCVLSLSIGSAFAQDKDFDDRWYVTAGMGANQQDSDRDTENAMVGTLGVGKNLNPNWSMDVELDYQNPKANRDEDLNYSQYGLSLDARRHFRKEDRSFNPYILMGVGVARAEEEYNNFPSPQSPAQREDTYATAKLGLGVESDFNRFERVRFRGEVFAKASFDDNSYINPSEDEYIDTVAQIALVMPLGAKPVKTVASAPIPTPTPLDCSQLDDDRDGVNNCADKCPNSIAGSMVGKDGCPVPVTIDLRGVNFGFDEHTLTSQSRQILDDAIEILQRYPDMQVEVAGHTDSIGSEEYNKGLSQRRARAVYDYLTQNGINASRLSGPIGYGESRPIAPNTNRDGSDNPQGRAQNRRTELNVEN